MWTNVLLNLAILALYDGSIDVAGLKEKYSDLIDELAALEPPEPYTPRRHCLCERGTHEPDRHRPRRLHRVPDLLRRLLRRRVPLRDADADQPIVAYPEDCVECKKENKCELECPEECIKVVPDFSGIYWPEVV